MIDGLVYKKIDKDYKFRVPEQMIPSLLRVHHDDMAHIGVEKTYHFKKLLVSVHAEKNI